MLDYQTSIDMELNKSLKEKVVFHKQRFVQLFKARYLELLPSLIKYHNHKTVSIDFNKVEVALRNGYDVVIGETRYNNIQVIGFATSKQTVGNPAMLWGNDILRHSEINFVIPESTQLNYYKEITHNDECKTGNFVVLRNKTLNYVSDISILDHYIDELSEIVLSRYSISMQVKITTLFLGEPNDETLNQIISDVYNGNPYITGTKLFDPDEQIYHMNNENIAQNFQELKREYQNKISELNNMLGINSLAVEKSSGVSDSEAKSNRAFTTSNSNIYLDGRNNGLEKLNKRYNFEIEAMYNDEVVSEFSKLSREDEKEGVNDNGTDHNNTI
ncbi:MAG: hypothetical protein L0K90_01875 [Staphylococcus equorum]|nr:hypothetical protein [Staphylococcus equorum]